MNEASGFLSSLGGKIVGTAAFLGAVAALITIGMQIQSINADYDATKQKLTLLETQLVDLAASVESVNSGAEGLPGPVGPKGDTGDVGPVGPSPDMATVSIMVEKALANLAEKPASHSPASHSNVDQAPTCFTLGDLEREATFTVRLGMELCSEDGALIGVVNGAYKTDFSFKVVGRTTSDSCVVLSVCQLPVANMRPFVLERITEDADGYAYLIRFNS